MKKLLTFLNAAKMNYIGKYETVYIKHMEQKYFQLEVREAQMASFLIKSNVFYIFR